MKSLLTLFLVLTSFSLYGMDEEELFAQDWTVYFPTRALPKEEYRDRFILKWKEGKAFEGKCANTSLAANVRNYTKNLLNVIWTEYQVDIVSPTLRESWFVPYLEGLRELKEEEAFKERINSPELSDNFPTDSEEERALCLGMLAKLNAEINAPIIAIMKDEGAEQGFDSKLLYVTLIFKKQSKYYRIKDHAGIVIEYFNNKDKKWDSRLVHLAGGGGSSGRASGSGEAGNYQIYKKDKEATREFVLWTRQYKTDIDPPDHTIVPFYRYATLIFDRTNASTESTLQSILDDQFAPRLPYHILGRDRNDNCCTYVARIIEALGLTFWKQSLFSKWYQVTLSTSYSVWFSANELRELIKDAVDRGQNRINLMSDNITDAYLKGTQSEYVRSCPMELYASYQDINIDEIPT